MFKKILLLILIFSISLVYADSSIINSKSEFDLGIYENTYYDNDSIKINRSDEILSLHFDNGDESTTFTDSSILNHVIVANGNIKQENTQKMYGESSAYFDGTGDYLKVIETEISNIGNKNFTIDFWAYSNDLTGFQTYLTNRENNVFADQGFGIYKEGDTYADKIRFVARCEDGTNCIDMRSSVDISASEWNHFTITRNGNIAKLYIDGIEVAEDITANGTIRNPPNASLIIGGQWQTGLNEVYNFFNGYIDEVRIVENKILWTENFTPPNQEYHINPTKLLLHFDGPDESQAHFYDYSDSKHSLTVYGDTKLDSSEKKFGESSAYFDGDGDYITISDSDDFDFGTEDFTIESWIYLNETQNNNAPIIAQWPQGGGVESAWAFVINNENKLLFYMNGVLYLTSASNLDINKWQHVSISRKDNKFNLYINGNIVNQTINTITIINSNNNIILGDYGGNTNPFQGYLDELKITKGEALYTTNFTPNNYQYYSGLNGLYQSQIFDMSSEVNWKNFTWLTNLYEDLEINSNTKLLLHFNGGDESTSFTDSSDFSHSITANGNVKQENTKTKLGPTAAYFDGTDDYLTIPKSEDWDLDGENNQTAYTIDFWFNLDSFSSDGFDSFLWRGDAGSDNTIQLDYVNTIDQFRLIYYNTTTTSNNFKRNYSLDLNTWYHFAIIYDNSSLSMYLNGEKLGNSESPSNHIRSANDYELYVGIRPSLLDRNLNGYIDELRIVKGKAMWTNNFTPPNQEYYSNPTKLLLHFDQGDESTNFIDSSISNHTITSYGNAKQENTSKRFGESAGYFDGTGDYLSIQNNDDFNFGTDDFTIDGWIYYSGTHNYKYRGIFGGEMSSGTNSYVFDINIENKFEFYSKSCGSWESQLLDPSIAPINAWTHFAITRKNDILQLYINGEKVSEKTGVSNCDYSHSNSNFILGKLYEVVENYYWSGYLDEFRIVKGKAIWTEDFAPPNQEYYSNLNNLTMKYRTCSNPDCSDEVWQETTTGNLTGLSSQYFQFQTLFSTIDICYNPELFNVSLNYLNIITKNPQYFIYPTPLNDSNLITNEVIINISSSETLSNCILHINSQDIIMDNYGTYCIQNLTEFNLEISQYNYNVSFTENSESKNTENRVFTYYPDYSEKAMPSQSLISILISIILILGGLLI